MSSRGERAVTFASEGLSIDGRLRAGEGKLAAVVLHPHPQYGGDMDSHVVMTLFDVLADEGATTLRFNFRGTGASEGDFDAGRGGAADAQAAVAYVRERSRDASLVLAGYSYGAVIAAAVAGDIGARALVLASPPAAAADLQLPDGIPTLVVTGDRDAFAPAAALSRLEAPGREVMVLEGVDHFWFPGADRLAEAVRTFLKKLRTDQ